MQIKFGFFLILSFFNEVCTMQKKIIDPFSFTELEQVSKLSTKKPSFIQATDGIKLAYYPFVPKNPSSIIIFYHGGGLYSNASYQHIGSRLEKDFNTGTYFIDIRGHGYSEGKRGDAPSINQVLDDITTIIQMVRANHLNVPIYLAGHSSGAGLLLNYSNYEKRRDDLYSGNILLAPYLGPRVGVEKSNAPLFVKKVRIWIYLLNQICKIPLFKHIPAVFFNYSAEILKKDPQIILSYTYTMSCATTPHNPALLFEQLRKPTFMFIGDKDEQFNAEKVVAFAKYNKKEMVTTKIIPNAKHLSILLQAPELISLAINREQNL